MEHGDIQPEIAQTWLGFVGPGVRNVGTSDIWTDHTDVRPTILTLLGLQDDYVHDGRAVVEPLFDWAVPQTLRAHRDTLLRLGQVYNSRHADVPEESLTRAFLYRELFFAVAICSPIVVAAQTIPKDELAVKKRRPSRSDVVRRRKRSPRTEKVVARTVAGIERDSKSRDACGSRPNCDGYNGEFRMMEKRKAANDRKLVELRAEANKACKV